MKSPSHPRPVIAVVGPTATGKTAMAVEIARWLDTEIISADSQQVYRELDIGTAKPTGEEQGGIPHHMIDVAAPDEVYSAAMFRDEAGHHLERLWSAGKVPVVAGGTGFYIRALLEADFLPDIPPDEAFRTDLLRSSGREEPGYLHRLLRARDPQRAADLHPNDHVRIIRALEIIEATGKSVPRQAPEKDMRILWLGLMYRDRPRLWRRIEERIDAMLAAGWPAEVEGLIRKYGPQAHALQVAHGYPELVQVALGERSLEDAVAQININVRQYSRRQLTWFRRNPDIHWMERDDAEMSDLLRSVRLCITEWGDFGM